MSVRNCAKETNQVWRGVGTVFTWGQVARSKLGGEQQYARFSDRPRRPRGPTKFAGAKRNNVAPGKHNIKMHDS